MKIKCVSTALVLIILAPLHLASADLNTIEKLVGLHEHAARELANQQRSYAKTPDNDNEIRLNEAKREYEKSLRNLDLARSDIVADFTEVRPDEIRAMRDRNASWEDIAREFGFHPSIIGVEIIDASPPPFAPVLIDSP